MKSGSTVRSLLAGTNNHTVTSSHSSSRPVLGSSGQQLQHSHSSGAMKPHQTNINRVNSFPKTSPLASLTAEYQVNPGSQAVTRAPNVTISQDNSSPLSTSAASTPWGVVAPSTAAAGDASQPQTVPAAAVSRGDKVSRKQTATASGLLQAQERAGRRSPSHAHRSPRGARKVSKHSSSAGAASSSSSSGLQAGRSHRTHHHHHSSSSSSTTATPHSTTTAASTTSCTTITQPNIIVGAMGDTAPTLVGATAQVPCKDKNIRDKDCKNKDKTHESKEKELRGSLVRICYYIVYACNKILITYCFKHKYRIVRGSQNL